MVDTVYEALVEKKSKEKIDSNFHFERKG